LDRHYMLLPADTISAIYFSLIDHALLQQRSA
jgi:hypothetical protein